MIKQLVVTFCLLCTFLVFSQEEGPITTPTIAVKVPLGETITLGTTQIEFLEVLEDSRCPKGATCVWEGQAKVKLLVTEDGGTPKEMELLFNSKYKITTIPSGSESVIKVLKLSPYPNVDDQGKRSYAILISEN